MTVAPARSSSCAIPTPTPRLVPVTMAIFPSRTPALFTRQTLDHPTCCDWVSGEQAFSQLTRRFMPEWVVILLALAAAVTSALGIVIRQRATLEIPQDEGVSTTMFKKLLRNRLWWAGTAVAASGYGF